VKPDYEQEKDLTLLKAKYNTSFGSTASAMRMNLISTEFGFINNWQTSNLTKAWKQ